MNNTYIYILGLVSVLLVMNACEDPIDVELNEGDTLIVVDGFLNDLPEDQIIKISSSQTYFDNSLVTGTSGAIVTVSSDKGGIFDFVDEGNGEYRWVSNGQVIGVPGDNFELAIELNGENLTSNCTMGLAPTIDSLVQDSIDNIFGKGIFVEFFARDNVGIGDTYWIKTFENGVFLNKPEEINIAYDAGFDSGAEADGLIFIPPIRALTNEAVDSLGDSPWAVGDLARVEIHTLNPEIFGFFETTRDQLITGRSGIFAEPLANATGNIVNLDSEKEVLGVFCVSDISSLDYIIQ